jgi:hypothetical protein
LFEYERDAELTGGVFVGGKKMDSNGQQLFHANSHSGDYVRPFCYACAAAVLRAPSPRPGLMHVCCVLSLFVLAAPVSK